MSGLTFLSEPLLEPISQTRAVLLLAACAGLGAAGAWLIAAKPFRGRLLDAPTARSSHTVPTPRGGGVGVLAAFTLAGAASGIPAALLLAGLLVSAVSFYGDCCRISVKRRLLVQILASLLILPALLPRLGAGLAACGWPPLLILPLLPLILLFLVGTANFYNFMDGINGIAGVSGTIAFGLLGLHALSRPAPDPPETALALTAIGLALACAGFLPFNLPKARVFMGDVGSVLLGFTFAALVAMLARSGTESACLAGLLFPFYADELTTMAVRLKDRESLTEPHRRHLYQLLANERKLAHWKVTLLYGGLQLAAGMVLLLLARQGAMPALGFLTACFTGFTLLSLHLRRAVKAP